MDCEAPRESARKRRTFHRPGLGLTILSIAGLGWGARTASAEGIDPVSQPAPTITSTTPTTSYSGQILAADFASLGVGLAVARAAGTPWAGAVTWSFASPIVHAIHHHPARAALSLLLHVGLPTLGALAGSQIGACPGTSSYETCYIRGLWAGGVLGAAVATTMDAAVLARLPEDRTAPVAVADADVGAAPALLVGRDGDLGVAWRGTF